MLRLIRGWRTTAPVHGVRRTFLHCRLTVLVSLVLVSLVLAAMPAGLSVSTHAAPAAPSGRSVVIAGAYSGSLSELHSNDNGSSLTAKLAWNGTFRRSIPRASFAVGAVPTSPIDTYAATASGSVVVVDKQYPQNSYSCDLSFTKASQTGIFTLYSPDRADDPSESDSVTLVTGVPFLIGDGSPGAGYLVARGGDHCAAIDVQLFDVFSAGPGNPVRDVVHNVDRDPQLYSAFHIRVDTTLPLLAANPVSRVYKVNDSVPEDYGGVHGSLKVKLASKLTVAEQTSCLILFQTAYDATSKTIPAVIGEGIQFTVTCGAGPNKVMGPILWKIGGQSSNLKTTSAIKDYQITYGPEPQQNRAVATVLKQADLIGPTIHFKVIRGSTIPVSVSTGNGSAQTTLGVSDPVLDGSSRSVTFCQVGVGLQSHRSPKGHDTNAPTLGLGLNDTCPVTPGVTWDFKVVLPKAVDVSSGNPIGGGTIRLVQLFSRSVSNSRGICLARREPLADTSSFYDTVFGDQNHPADELTEVTGSAGSTVTWHDTDSPWIHLTWPITPSWTPHTPNQYTEEFYAWDYVMYLSALPASVWIPVGELIWHWKGSAKWSLINGSKVNEWELVSGSEFNPTFANSSYVPRVIAPLPVWSSAIQAGGIPRTC